MYKIEVLADSRGDHWTAVLTACQADAQPEEVADAIALAAASRAIGSRGVASGDGFRVQVLSGEHDLPEGNARALALAYARQEMKPCHVTLVADGGVDEQPWRRRGFRVRQEPLASHPLRSAIERIYDTTTKP